MRPVLENNAARFLSRLPPTKRLIGVYSDPCSSSQFGFSVTDPYLSFAKPLYPILESSPPKRWWMDLAKTNDAAAFVFTLPVAIPGIITPTDVACQDKALITFVEGLSESNAQNVFCYCYKRRLSIDEALDRFADNLLWDETGLEVAQKRGCEDLPRGIHSAVMLQCFLDEMCGGWQNTFG